MFFSIDERKVLREKSPDLGFSDIMKSISESWKKLSDKQKTKYAELAEKDKERYQEELEKYKSEIFSATTN
jgi:arsenate reductase-like glutaredoxin family protein